MLYYTVLGDFMGEIKLNEEEFKDDYLLAGLDANGKVLELAKAYCTGIQKFLPLTKEEETKLFEEYYKSYNPRIKKEIIERHLRFVVWFIAKNKIKINGMEFMDVVQEGNYVLVKAFEKFKLDKGFRFLTYLNDSLTNRFIDCKNENSHYLSINNGMKRLYDKYLEYKMEYKEKNGVEPSKNEVMAKFKIMESTYNAFKSMELAGDSVLSLDETLDETNAKLYDFVPSEFNGIDDYESFVDNRLLLLSIRKILTPLEYYLFYNYTFDPENFVYEKLGFILGVSRTSIGNYMKDISDKIKNLNKTDMQTSNDGIKKIEKMDFKPINFPKKVILIYMFNKLSMEEFYYIYNAWYMNFDEEILKRKFNKFGINYEELRLRMQDTVDNLNYLLNNRYQDVLKIVKKKYSIAQIFDKDLTIKMDLDYHVSKCLDNLSYEEVLSILGDNFEALDDSQKQSLYSYYNYKYKWKRIINKEDIEAKINLKRHGFKRKRNISLDKLYKVYLDNPDMFEEDTRELLEGSLFNSYTHKKGIIKDNSSVYYRSLWRLEEKYYKLDNYFNFDIPKKEHFRILKEYNYLFTDIELKVLHMHSKHSVNRATLEETALLLAITPDEVKNIYFWAKNKVLLLYLGIYNVKVIDNEPLYVNYVNDPKFDITPKAREIGRMRFIEHLNYEEIADKVKLEDDKDNNKKKSKTSKVQKVSNIVTKLIRSIEIHHYNILNEVNINETKVLLLLDKLKYKGEEKEIIKDYYIEKLTMDELKSKYDKTQSEINNIAMKFKYTYISNYKSSVEQEDIIKELNEHITDTVLTSDQRTVLAYILGIKFLIIH